MQTLAKRSEYLMAAIVLLSSAAAPKPVWGVIVTWVGGTGNWTDTANWSDGNVPGAGPNYGMNNDGTAIIDSVVPDIGDIGLGWPTGNTKSGHLEIQTGGVLTTTTSDGIDVGVRGGTSNMSSLKVSGGALNITGTGYLVIGDEGGSHGTVEISSGSITVAGALRIGVQGEGNFIIHGNSSSITVGGDLTFHETGGAYSRLIPVIDSGGISPIQVAGNTTLDNSPELWVSLSALAPHTDLVLVDNSPTSVLTLANTFFNYAQGDPVSAVFGATTYNWTIDYGYGADDNDIALVFVSAVTAVPGDYNEDGFVDAADYVVWRNGGSPDSSQAGYDLWRSNFGNPAGSGSNLGGNSAVPEPGTILPVLAGIAGLAGFGPGRCRRWCGSCGEIYTIAQKYGAWL